MKYLELINKCLVELNYKQVNAFSELVKNDHKKIKNILNVLNKEICSSQRWGFLQRKTEFILQKNIGEVENLIDGRIEAIIADGKILQYFPDFEKFFTNSEPSDTYSFYDDKILFSESKKDRNIEILYYSNKCVKTSQGVEKNTMEDADDESLIPDIFAEPLLVYGTCMRLKGNPQHVRFSYWLSMYNDALANMHSRITASVDDFPNIKLSRR